MSISELGTQISLWVRKHIRGEDVEAKDDWVTVFRAVKPFRGNWTKAINQSGISLEEQMDLYQELLRLNLASRDDKDKGETRLGEWDDLLHERNEELKKVLHEAAVVAATPQPKKSSREDSPKTKSKVDRRRSADPVIDLSDDDEDKKPQLLLG
jgi:hypothetical protein